MTPAEAREELLTKTLGQINEDSARTWVTKALAAKQLFAETGDMRWAIAFSELRHEACEHASLSEDSGFYAEIRATLHRP